MKDSFESFLQDYEDRIDDVGRSDWSALSLYLTDWLDLLDSSPLSSAIVRDLGSKSDFNGWFAEESRFRAVTK